MHQSFMQISCVSVEQLANLLYLTLIKRKLLNRSFPSFKD
nr:MAG TPA: hypothetical protein [Caudoviricetes sp.]